VQPALAKFYNSLSDEQKARFNSLRSASRPAGWRTMVHFGCSEAHPSAVSRARQTVWRRVYTIDRL